MREELGQMIREYNKKAAQAESDGFLIMYGSVYSKPKRHEVAKKICDVMDYENKPAN